ncbi:LysM peptidoglycan-binding domain-containing protein, partial [Candidatus Bathyarchaeota archaeon]|nr:LysM peptidoglycan-binding domain-containing protein [Candidatus Bathyarchaeota archaeon]
YYVAKSGDTCAAISEDTAISLGDLFFLNIGLNKPGCDNLQVGSAYCVAAVGDIRDYPYYG